MRCLSRPLAASGLVLTLAACAPSLPPANPTAETTGTTPPAVSASAAPAPAAPAEAPAAKKAPEPEVLASESSPPGLNRLSKEESEAAKKSCTPLTDALAAAAKKKKIGNAAERNAFLEEFLANPPKLPKIDVARCADLMIRDLRAYLAATIESEATMNIGRIVVGLATSMEREPPQLCPSTKPVPLLLSDLAQGPVVTGALDWEAPGWTCSRFGMAGDRQRFQYQLVTDARAGTWEVIARGFPVKGGAPTELYARGRVENGQIKMTREVFRRSPTP